MIVWLNGTHGVGKTTVSGLVQQLIPDSRVSAPATTSVDSVKMMVSLLT